MENQRYFAVVQGSLEKHAQEELEGFGARVLQEVPRGFYFSCSQAELYRILYESRLLQRVLLPLLSFDCHSTKYLYREAYNRYDWTQLFGVKETFGIISNVGNSAIKHSLYAGQTLKDAICDRFRSVYNARPDFTTKNPDILFNLHIFNNHANIYLDILGQSMHRRGYRKKSMEAPMQETVAAAMVRLSEWDGNTPLWDPMCGSGTILAEALMFACNIPAGYLRDDSKITKMPDFDTTLWENTVREANARIRTLPKGLIFGSDMGYKSVAAAKENLKNLPGGDKIEIWQMRFQDFDGKFSGYVLTNPPYGVRLGNPKQIHKLYQDLGDFLKQRCGDSIAFILCGEKALIPKIRLRAHWDKSLKNGNLDSRLAKIVILPDRR